MDNTKPGPWKPRYIMDDGHAWLEVEMALLNLCSLNTPKFEPSRYSYYSDASDATWGRTASMAYLEEDVDAPAFLQSIGIDLSLLDQNVQEEYIPGNCWIRKLPRFGN